MSTPGNSNDYILQMDLELKFITNFSWDTKLSENVVVFLNNQITFSPEMCAVLGERRGFEPAAEALDPARWRAKRILGCRELNYEFFSSFSDAFLKNWSVRKATLAQKME